MFKATSLLATTALAVQFSTPLKAQEAANEPFDENVIIVTATKTEKSLQDVPIAVSVFSGEDLSDRGIDEVSSLQQVAPSLLINTTNTTSGGGTIRIRGIGTNGNNIGLESAVGFFQDGAYRSRSGQALTDLLDVGQIEILRGPQGTLFGKNTSAGAITVASNAPEFSPSARLSATIGNLDLRQYEGVVTGPVAGDRLAFRLAARRSVRDGDVQEITTGERFNNRDRWAVKGQLLWEPTDQLSARLIVDISERNEACCSLGFSEVGATGAILEALGGNVTVFPGGRMVGVNNAPIENTENRGAVLEVEYENDGWALTSVTVVREFEAFRRQDNDFTNVDLFQFTDNRENFSNWSQEIRVSGSTGTLDWLVGGFVFGEDLTSDGRVLARLGSQGPDYFASLIGAPAIADILQPGDGVSGFFEQESNGWALFANSTFQFTDTLSINGGLRYSSEQKSASSIVNQTGTDGIVDDDWPCALVPVATFCGNAGYALDRDEGRFTATAKLIYEPTSDLTIYAGWANGFKAGGFNLDPLAYKLDTDGSVIGDGREFEEETVDSFEIGVKSFFPDADLRLSFAAFYSTFEDFQINTFTGTVFVVDNIPELVTKGVELEYDWRLARGINLTGGITYADARYTENTPIVNGSAAFGGPTNLEDLRSHNAPKWQSSAALSINRDIAALNGWGWNGNINWLYRSGYNTGADLDPQKYQDGFSLVNAKLGIARDDGKIGVTLWARNLFDVDYRQFVVDAVLQPGSWSQTLGEARTYGVTLSSQF